jgi:cell division septal protein FtsQ
LIAAGTLCAAAVAVSAWAWSALCGGKAHAGLCGWDRIERVEVRGVVRLAERQVRAWAAVPMGQSLWELAGDDVIARLEGRPWVGSVTVGKRFPDTVVITVTERVPVAIAVTSRGRVLLDAEGRVIGPTAIDRGFPVVRGATVVRPEALAAAAHILAAFRAAEVSMAAIESVVIDVSRPDDPVVELPGALRVRFGRQGFPEKWRRLQAIHENAASRIAGPRVVDMRFSDRAIVSEWSRAL